MSKQQRTGGMRGRIADFFAEHKGETFTTRQIAEKFDLSCKRAAPNLFHLFQRGVLARCSHGREFRYWAAGTTEMPESRLPVSADDFCVYQLGVLAFLQRNAGQDFSATEIAQELCRDRKSISGTLLYMCLRGLVRQIPGTYPYRYTIADDERIPALLLKAGRNPGKIPDEIPLSPFWQGMAIWDNAVRSAICHKMH
jgi:hypothetical protein